MPELWKDGSKRDGLLPVLWRKDAGGNSDEEETPGDDTEDVTLREEDASLFEEEAVKGDAARSQEAAEEEGMIQDIGEHTFDNQYHPCPPDRESYALYYETMRLL